MLQFEELRLKLLDLKPNIDDFADAIGLEKLKKQLDECLRGYLEEHPEPAKQELVAAFGPPEELARLLMNQFPEKERKRRRMVRKILLGVSAAVTVLILIFAVYVFS